MAKGTTALGVALILLLESVTMTLSKTIMTTLSTREDSNRLQQRSLELSPYILRRTFIFKSGYMLQIWPDGVVNGTRNETNHDYAILRIMTIPSRSPLVNTSKGSNPSKIAVRVDKHRMWLCMNRTGHLYGDERKTSECEFIQKEGTGSKWTVYYSAMHRAIKPKGTKRWYVTLDPRTGKSIKGYTKVTKASKFLEKAISSPNPAKISHQIKPTNPVTNNKKTRINNPIDRTSRYRKYRLERKRIRGIKRWKNRSKKKKNRRIELDFLLGSFESSLKGSQAYSSQSTSVEVEKYNPAQSSLLSLLTGDKIRHPEQKSSRIYRRNSQTRRRQ